MSEIEILDDSFITSGLGVDGYFHRLRLRGKICEYFCWELIEAKWLGEVFVEACVSSQRAGLLHSRFTSDGCQLNH